MSSDTKPIESPFYPERYSNNQECSWLVNAPSTSIVRFHLSFLDLAQGDYLEIHDGANKEATMLKNLTSETKLLYQTYTSTGRFLFVRFKSDYQQVGSGFRINVLFTYQNTSKLVCISRYFYFRIK